MWWEAPPTGSPTGSAPVLTSPSRTPPFCPLCPSLSLLPTFGAPLMSLLKRLGGPSCNFVDDSFILLSQPYPGVFSTPIAQPATRNASFARVIGVHLVFICGSLFNGSLFNCVRPSIEFMIDAQAVRLPIPENAGASHDTADRSPCLPEILGPDCGRFGGDFRSDGHVPGTP